MGRSSWLWGGRWDSLHSAEWGRTIFQAFTLPFYLYRIENLKYGCFRGEFSLATTRNTSVTCLGPAGFNRHNINELLKRVGNLLDVKVTREGKTTRQFKKRCFLCSEIDEVIWNFRRSIIASIERIPSENHRVSWNFKGRQNVYYFFDPGKKDDSHFHTNILMKKMIREMNKLTKGQKYLFMQDGAWAHTANFTLDKLNKEK